MDKKKDEEKSADRRQQVLDTIQYSGVLYLYLNSFPMLIISIICIYYQLDL